MTYPVELRNAEGSVVREAGSLVFTGAQPGGTSVSNVTALAQQASSGATSITLNTTPAWLNAQTFVIIGPRTTGANLRRVTSVSNGVLTLDRALGATFAASTTVFVWVDGPQLIPWSLWGGLASNAQSDATTNTTAFNNLSQEIYNLGNWRGWGIAADVGNWYVNNELKIERDQKLVGVHPTGTQILPADAFPFAADGSVAIIHPQRDGSPVLFKQQGPSGRWYFENLLVNGRSVANSCGIITSPQQPDHGLNVRVDGCAGAYGISINDCQVYDADNIELNNCAAPLVMWQAKFVDVSTLNITNTTGIACVQLIDSINCRFETCDLETSPSGTSVFLCTGSTDQMQFDNCYTSGFTGGSPNSGDFFHFDCPTANPGGKCNYVINNAFCNQNLTTVNMVNDVQRSITLNTSTDTNRSLTHAFAQDTLYWYTVAGGKIKTNATYIA